MLTRTQQILRQLLLAVCLLASLPVFAAPIRLLHLRMSAQPHTWRLVFRASGPVHFRTFVLQRPYRVVVDVDNARLYASLKHINFLNSPVSKIRAANHTSGRLRLVFDMNRKAKTKVFALNPSAGKSHRLVIDVTGTKRKVLAFSWPTSKSTTAKIKAAPTTLLAPLKKTLASTRPVVILIDPGHGGKDPGATGPRGTHEKTIVLAISKKLQKLINARPGFVAKLTRRGDYYLTLRQRLAIARRDKADMFVAIHADKWYNSRARGASVFALSQRGATSEAARWIAKQENHSELMGGLNLNDKTRLLKSVLINLSQTATIRSSLVIGQYLINTIRKITTMHAYRVEQAAFVVLKSPDIPSLLVETGFLSNPTEERQLRSPRFQWRLSRAIMAGIVQYFKNQPPRGTWLAMKKNKARGS